MTKKPQRGRPPLGNRALLAPVMIRFPAVLLKQIDRIAAKRLDRPARSAIVRELVAEAIKQRARNKRRG